MKKLIIFIIILIFNLNLFAYEKMYWEIVQGEEDKVVEQLTYDISDFILEHQAKLKKQGLNVYDIKWTTYNRIYRGQTSSYPCKLKAGVTYIVYTYTTGEKIKACWMKDRDNSYSTIKRGNRIIYYYTPTRSGDYHYLVSGNGAKQGIHVSYITRIVK